MKFLRFKSIRPFSVLAFLLLSASWAQGQTPAISSSLSDSTVVDQPYSYTITATNAPTSFGATNLPVGLSRSGDTISGTPTEAGTYAISLLVSNASGYDLEELILTVTEAIPSITSATTASGNVGDPFSYTITADNNPSSFEVIGLESFPGLSFDSVTGVISGSPAATASGDVIIEATNAGGSGFQTLTITINPAVTSPPVIVSSLSENAVAGSSFTYTIEATNESDTFAISGTLPAGLFRSGRVITGTPTETGVFIVDLFATNDFGTSAAATLTLTIDDPSPVITSASTASGSVGTAFEFTVEALNNPTSYSIIGLGSFPGLSFNTSTGVISGTPTAEATGDLFVFATNTTGTGSDTVSLTIGPATNVPPTITSALTENATTGLFYSYSINATNSPDSFAISGDPLPAGLNFSGDTISGFPTETGTFNIDLEASNAFGTGTATLVLTVADPAPVITSASTAGGNINVPFSYSIEATNNPTSFGIIGLGSFPGLSFNSSTGEISGTPTTEVSGDVVVSATNAAGTDSATVTLIFDSDQPPAITSSLTEEVTLGDFFFYPITATNSPSLYAISGDALPEGLSFSSGFISGTPTETGTFNIGLEATNSFGTGTATLVLTVADPAPIITSPTIAVGNVNRSFSFFVTAANNPSSFGITGLGSFPGLSFNSTTGEISGTPTATATGSVTVSATNAAGTDSDTLSITIDPELGPPVITSSLTESTSVGAGYSYTILATNSPTVYSISGDALPSGLVRSGNLISGTPLESGTFNIDLIVSNGLGSDTETLVLTVADPLPNFTSESEVLGQVSDDFLFLVKAKPNITSYSASGLDVIGGLSLDSGTGEITGTPVNSGSYDVIVQATNSTGTTQMLLSVFILEAEDLGTGPTVNVISVNGVDPATSPTFPADTGTLEFVAEVEPDIGETLEVAFLRWRNPPLSSNVIMVELVPEDPLPANGPISYTGTADLGFDPSNREFTGGELQFDVVATQRNDTTDAISFGTSAEESIVVAPILEIIQPDGEVPIKSIDAGSIFAGVRLATSSFGSIRAQLSGIDTIIDLTDSDESDNPNGVFSFNAPQDVDFPGIYRLTVTATDSTGSETTLTRDITILNDPTVPVAVIKAPRPGFRNTVFTPALFEFTLLAEPSVKRNLEADKDEDGNETGLVSGTITATYEYEVNLSTGGNGYYPYSSEDEWLFYSFFDPSGELAGTARLGGNVIEFGRIVPSEPAPTFSFDFSTTVNSLPEAFAETIVPEGYGSAGNGVVDLATDPGVDSRINLQVEFSKADAELDSFRIFINGEEITPGSGNLNPENGPIFVPQFDFPLTGSPKPGNYVVHAEVTDQDGEVGISQPLTFQISPFNEIFLDLTSDRHEGLAIGDRPVIDQGTSVSFFLEAEPLDQVSKVEFFDSVTDELLGEASRVTLAGVEQFRLTQNFDTPGVFSLYAKATSVTRDEWLSSPLDLFVSTVADAEISITEPLTDVSVILGGSVILEAEATATPGIESITWFVNNFEAETVNSESASFVFDSSLPEYSTGSYTITATTTDNFGNPSAGAPEEINVTVLPPDVAVSITSPSSGAELLLGNSVTLTAEASATPGVARIEWYEDAYVEGVSEPLSTDFASTSEYSFSATPGVYDPGEYRFIARTVDNFGNVDISTPVLLRVLPSDVEATITAPTSDQTIRRGEELTFTATASATIGIQAVRWTVFNGSDEVLSEEDSSSPYSLTYTFSSTGSFRVQAVAVDSLGISSPVDSVSVSVIPPNPLVRNQDFVLFVYEELFGRSPTSTEVENALAVMDDTLGSRVDFLAALLESSDINDATTAPIIFRTMTGAWPSPEELEQAQVDLFSAASRTETSTGVIPSFGIQNFSYSISEGSQVSATVQGANAEDLIALRDPTLTITSPSGVQIAFDNDSGGGLTPLINFIATTTGTYTFTVGGFGSSAGSFNLNLNIFTDGDEVGNPPALIQALLSEYEARFGSDYNSQEFVRQIFINKHGIAPDVQSEVRLYNAAVGSETPILQQTIPGYLGDLDSYAAGFALDNEISNFTGPSGFPLSAVHLYERPNDISAKAMMALLVSAFLDEVPSDSLVNTYSALPLSQAIEQILTDSRYISQFPATSDEDQVAQYMAEFGEFDLSLNGPDDDADGDGSTNLEESNFGSDPTDPSNTAKDGLVAERMAGFGVVDPTLNSPDADADGDGYSNLQEIALGSDPSDASNTVDPMTADVDGTDFVVTFIKLTEAAGASVINITVQCSETMADGTWVDASPALMENLAADQSGVPDGYERIELRMDTTAQDCDFVRVLVD